jgi:hypothetical protein
MPRGENDWKNIPMVKMKNDAKIWKRWKEMSKHVILQNVRKIWKIQNVKLDFTPRDRNITRTKRFKIALFTQHALTSHRFYRHYLVFLLILMNFWCGYYCFPSFWGFYKVKFRGEVLIITTTKI